MCVILVGEARVPRQFAREAWALNPDGGGVAWWDGREWVVVRGLMAFREWWRVYSAAFEVSGTVVAHLRLRSSGGRGPEFTHPVAVPGHGGWWLFHNGSVVAPALLAAAGVQWDTAAVAWLLSRTRRGRWVEVLHALGSRWVLLGPGRYWVVGPGWRQDFPVKGVRSCGCLPGSAASLRKRVLCEVSGDWWLRHWAE